MISPGLFLFPGNSPMEPPHTTRPPQNGNETGSYLLKGSTLINDKFSGGRIYVHLSNLASSKCLNINRVPEDSTVLTR